MVAGALDFDTATAADMALVGSLNPDITMDPISPFLATFTFSNLPFSIGHEAFSPLSPKHHHVFVHHGAPFLDAAMWSHCPLDMPRKSNPRQPCGCPSPPLVLIDSPFLEGEL